MKIKLFFIAGLGFLGCTVSHAYVSTSDVVNVQLDTRTYNITVVSEQPYCSPEPGVYGVARGGGIGLMGFPEEGSNTSYIATGWVSEGGTGGYSNPDSPEPWYQGSFYPTSLVSSVTWSWDTYYRLEYLVQGSGAVSVDPNESWFVEGSPVTLEALPVYGWLFTGWSGDVSGGPNETNKIHVMNAPVSTVADFSDDPDGDGLKNTNEWAVGSNPWMTDTDGDGFDDKTEVEYGLSPTADSSGLVTYIQNNDATFALYSSNAVLDLAVGQVAMNVEGSTARLQLQVEQSEDLVIWTNAGEAVEWTLPVSGNKKFLRVRSGSGE